jgi:hypothetical protein
MNKSNFKIRIYRAELFDNRYLIKHFQQATPFFIDISNERTYTPLISRETLSHLGSK